MKQSYYLAPIQPTVDTANVANQLGKLLAKANICEIFQNPEIGLPDLFHWVRYPEESAEKMVDLLYKQDFNIYSGAYNKGLLGYDITSIHADVCRHLRIPMVLLLDGSALSAAQLTESIHIATATAKQRFTPVAAAVVFNAPTGISEDADGVTVISLAGSEIHTEDLQPVFQAVEQMPEMGMTPIVFKAMLISRARQNRQRIVLPETEDDRILYASAELNQLDVVDLVLLGNPESVRHRAAELKLDLGNTEIIDTTNKALLDRYAKKLTELRAHKGVTLEKAYQLLEDSAYFGTMMIVCKDADGMVSGANHTTANTIRPALQLIKTKPGVSTVSGAFLMLFDNYQHLYADCAVTIKPTVDQLADIALTSAETAAAFGIDPKVALISYSTGTSGTGETVDLVTEATAKAKAARPNLALDGPLQFDAAMDPTVAAKKCPESAVGGKASVYVFNSLDVGNCTYKAVQRCTGAIAVGPVLQGLNAPVNDLSRGALVEDIVSTVIITAVQAQE